MDTYNIEQFTHVPVLLGECLDGLKVRRNGVYVDGTAGGGGHSSLIAERLAGTGRLICVDRDAEAIEAAERRLAGYGNVTLVHGNFADIASILDKLGVSAIDGALLDLGVSSRQLDTASRGFSFFKESALDMRMDQSQDLTAFHVVNSYDEDELTRIFRDFGEERYAKRIAARIASARSDKPIETTLELSDIIAASIPRDRWEKGKHPATRVFQAVRIEVNGELDILRDAVNAFADRLIAGGRLCVVTFHSLEDRIIKNAFQLMANPCECPRDLPVCVCGKQPVVRLVTRKPITASDIELDMNVRSRSAKLRVVEKL